MSDKAKNTNESIFNKNFFENMTNENKYYHITYDTFCTKEKKEYESCLEQKLPICLSIKENLEYCYQKNKI